MKSVDGGYAWLVLAACILVNIITFGVAYCTGVFYVIFLDHLTYESPSMVALALTLNPGVFFIIGPLAGLLINKFGLRKIGLLGGVLSSSGILLSTISTNVYYNALIFGVLTGAGFGLSYLVGITAVTERFEKYRTAALGLALAAIGAGILIYPIILRLLYDTYGFRGFLWILGGITLHLIVCAAIFKPLPISHHIYKKKSEDLSETRNSGLFNTHIFKNVHYCLYCLASILNCFAMSVVQVHLAKYSQTQGYSEDSSALLFSTMGACGIFGQILWSLLEQVAHFPSTILYTTGFLLAGVVSLLIPLHNSYIWLHICSGLFSLFCPLSMIPVVIVDVLGADMMASGYGNLLLFEALGQTLGGPVAGMLYQYSKVYANSMYLAGGVCVISTMLMTYPCIKYRHSGQTKHAKNKMLKEDTLESVLSKEEKTSSSVTDAPPEYASLTFHKTSTDVLT